jgi:hypothetical protein
LIVEGYFLAQFGFSSLKISPNPSSGAAILSVFAPKSMELTLRATSLDGQWMEKVVRVLEGENQLQLIDFESLPSGLYFISVHAPGFRQVVKWVKG